jgi:hypothetical protein
MRHALIRNPGLRIRTTRFKELVTRNLRSHHADRAFILSVSPEPFRDKFFPAALSLFHFKTGEVN